MKKLTLVTIALLLIGMCFSGCSANTSNSRKPYDSLNTERDELKKIKKYFLDKSNDTIISFFFGTNLYRFERGDSIQEIWESPVLLLHAKSYTVVSKSGENAKTYIDFYGDEPQYDSYKEFLYALNTKKVFEKDVKVQNVYCFAEDISMPNADNLFEKSMPFVYYVTNKGDFVLCRLENDGDTYLFPLDKFKEYVHAIYVEDDVERRALELQEELKDQHVIPDSHTYIFTNLIPSPEAFDLTPYIFEEIT